MEYSKEELVKKIEDKSIDEKHNYEEVYQNSVQLDSLIEQYIAKGY